MNVQPKTLHVETESRITTVTINRPDKLNALNDQVLNDLLDVFRELQEDEETDGIILTGAGEKAFAAGADIAELSQLKKKSGERASHKGQTTFSVIESTGKPVIAAIEGYALGGGCELAMACHLRIASKSAKFGLPELGLGLIPGYGGTQRLPRLIGKGRALEMILDGSPVEAGRALEFGLVNRVVEDGQTAAEARKWLEKILTKSPTAINRAIQAVHSAYANRAQGFYEEARLFGSMCETEEFQEGTGAFLDKRKPEFKNK